MSWFKKKTDPKEERRATERAVRQTNRELDSDRRALERKEKELVRLWLELEIKKLAKLGKRDACAILAKQIVLLRKQKEKSINISAKVNAIDAKNRHLQSMAKVADVVGKSAETMKVMEKQMPVDKITKDVRDLAAAQGRFGVCDEMITEKLDEMLDESGDEAEEQAIIDEVLDEVGIDINAQVWHFIKTTRACISSNHVYLFQLSKAPRTPATLTSVSEESKNVADVTALKK
ncbi:unnamed protein product [Anisakis simplex]|uniref:Charged multivesicular body protein 2b (inferred by orthology to a human protein) n=1 Tax=Anisakis simplex TaxID=6269 RepID=A0A0M3JYN8_ANISI|nr:unnamed protein product [Anisakis simplex]